MPTGFAKKGITPLSGDFTKLQTKTLCDIVGTIATSVLEGDDLIS